MDLRGMLGLRAAVVLAVVVIAAGTAAALASDKGEADRLGSVRTRAGAVPASATTAATSSAAAPLRLIVAGPVALTIGQRAAYTLRWAAEDGTVTGSGQDWGDGVGIDGSGPVGSGCSGVHTGAATVPDAGRLGAVHRWSAAGTYRVRFTVSSTGCATGRAIDDTASAELVVVVTSR